MNPGSPHSDLRAALLAELEERAPKVDRDRVAACFDFAAAAHGDQRRVSGQPFVSHSIEVCRILLDLFEARLDTTLACSALLHDVVEDTDTSLEVVEKRFGKDVAGLVEGVTKLSGLHFDSRESAQAENFRKMLLSMSRDLRVIFVKLADRLHNMRTLEFLPPERQKRIATETREIYAPLAHRLGIASIKRELEDLSLKALDPQAYQELADRIQARREEREAFLAEVRDGLVSGLKAAGIRAEVTGRPKHFYSIYTKMQAGRPLETIHDLLGLRIICHSRNDCYRALGVVHDVFTPVADRFKDYIATPKSNLYQSLHTTVLTEGGEMVEVQIRTRDMHRTAETGVAAHYVYKQGGRVDAELDARLGGFVAQTADWQNTTSDDEYMDFLRTALYQEEVFVYTPRRELKRLPKGSTPLDFAFLIHTEVGQRTVGARVNGELVPLRYELRERRHGRDHDLAPGPAARGLAQDRAHRRRAHQGAPLAAPAAPRRQRLARPGDARARAASGCASSSTRRELEEIAQELGLRRTRAALRPARRGPAVADPGRAQAGAGEGDASPSGWPRARSRRSGSGASRPAAIRIQGIDNVMLHFARCCQPVPGDRVIGIVTQGRGVSVHRQDCPEHLRRPRAARAQGLGRVGRRTRRDVPGAARGLRPRPHVAAGRHRQGDRGDAGQHPHRRDGERGPDRARACSWSRCRTSPSCRR